MTSKKKYFKVAILGLGYVGLPLYINCKKKNIDVIGFDIDPLKVNSLNKDISYISDVSNEELKKIKKKNIFPLGEINKISDRNIIIFCLPTPLKQKDLPDLSYIKNALSYCKNHIKRDVTLILESTVYPGATRELFNSFLNPQKKINYGFSSERISPGQVDKKIYKISFTNIPKVVSGCDNSALNKISKFYSLIFNKIHKTRNIEIAEMSKLLENSYRAVNISFINELKIICHENRINIHEVIEAASTKPFGFTKFVPGPGVGGHCIPIDPLYLNWYARKTNQKSSFTNLAKKTNLKIQKWIINKINKNLEKNKKNKILILGVAYKKDISDIRESPAINIISKLIKKNKIEYFDPFVPIIEIEKKKIKSIKTLKDIRKYNIVILLTDHSNLPYNSILKNSRKIIDTRGIFKINQNNKVVYL